MIDDLTREQLFARLSDYRWRLNNLYKVTDKYGNVVTFKLNPVQQQLDDELHYLNLILKSRQHGITTYGCIRALDMALFRPNVRTGIIAHTKKDAEGFFSEKVLFAYDQLPEWLKRVRPTKRRDMHGELKLSNESTVEVSVSHRGGTLQLLHVSEFGPMCSMFPKRAKEVTSGALNTVAPGNIVMIESTAYGTVGDYADRCKVAMDYAALIKAGSAQLTEMDYKFHFFPWFSDTRNVTDPKHVPITPVMAEYFDHIEEICDVALSRGQRAWYIKKSVEQRDDMKREHPSTPQEAFEASVEGAYFGRWMEEAAAQGRIGAFPFNPAKPVHTCWDIGKRDGSAIWFFQENGGWYDFIGYWSVHGEQAARCAQQLDRYAKERGYVYGKHYCPHDIEVVDWIGHGNQTRQQVLEGMGVRNIEKVDRIPNKMEAIDMARRILHRCRFDVVNCGPPVPGGKDRGGIEALKNYRKEWNEQTQAWMDSPLKDWTTEAADAFMQFAQWHQDERPARAGERADHENWKTG